METGKDVLVVARRNFEQAQQNRAADLAAAKTPDKVKAILDNYGAAFAAYLECLGDAFQAASGNWTALLNEAKDAEKAITKARQEAQGIAKTIEALGKFTGVVAKLVDAVKG